MNEYITLLQKHDWFYEYSDDYQVWNKGSSERSTLVKMAKELDPYRLVWNQYCPERYKALKTRI